MLGQDLYDQLVEIPGIAVILKRFETELPYEFEHAHSLFELVHIVASDMSLESEKIETLGGATLLHDCGKLFRPGLYNMKRRVTERERNYLRLHPKIGYRMIIGHKILPRYGLVAEGHHEHCSDRYPRDIYSNGHDIPQERRNTNPDILFMQQLLCACDFVDAQLRDRPYRKAKQVEEVITILRRDFMGEAEIVKAIEAQNLKAMYN